MIITAGRQGEQLCWSELWTRFSARTGDLAAEDRSLVPQDQDLHLLGGTATRSSVSQPNTRTMSRYKRREANEHDRR